MSPTEPPRILPCGDQALVVEFGDSIEPGLNALVLELDRIVAGRPGIVETIPTYRSLLVVYDPGLVGFDELGRDLTNLSRRLTGEKTQGTTWTVPVAYGGENGIDLDATAAHHGITPDELVRRHSAPTYRVYMIGFLPGFAYLGGLDPSIAISRRVSPRLHTPAGTISIGGIQALVASLAAPSGWHLLGRTPVRNFMPSRDPAVIIRPGDQVRFTPIDEGEFARLEREARLGRDRGGERAVTSLEIRACGPMTSLQDKGRTGAGRDGISRSGAMDRWALALANALVGNPPSEGAVELMLLGATVRAEGGAVRMAVAGAAMAVTLDGESVASNASFTAPEGATVAIAPASAGIYAYLAVAGGLAVPSVLGSVSLQPRAKIGGLDGRALRPGDRLPLRDGDAPGGPEMTLAPRPGAPDEGPIRVVLGPQDDLFGPDAVAAFLSQGYTVSGEADRMGYRLAGPPIGHLGGFNIVSDGLVAGSVQVPGSGVPIVMMADHQTTGGYPKIATVISADLGRLAQTRSGEPVRFAAVDVASAQAIARDRAAEVAALPGRLVPVRGWPPTVEELLGLNLAGAATDAMAAPEP